LNLTAVRTRFLWSVGANVVRAVLSLATGLMVARGLDPSRYGDLTYLLGSFIAIRALLDMGSSNAFYTFISRQPRGRPFYLLYFAWQLLQFAVSLLVVAAVLPQDVVERIWLGHSREMILLALVASFMQQQVWTTITQLGESTRLTVKVQSLGLAIAATHLAIIAAFKSMDALSVKVVLIALIGEYLIVLPFASRVLRIPALLSAAVAEPRASAILAQYWRYCRPLIVVGLMAFVYEFADKWLLQRFGGSSQQGFYQIAAQLSAVSLIATTSILNIFWKEIAEASAREDYARLGRLYKRVSRGLLMLGAVASCILIPWSRQIVALLLGSAYQESWPVLALMLLYPIHQSIGQVNATMFMASERTWEYMAITLAGQFASLPISYFLLASPEQHPVSGLGLGAYGLALKMVGLNLVLVNFQAWIIAKFGGWKFEWVFQVVGIAGLLLLGSLSKLCAVTLFSGAGTLEFAAGAAASGTLYLAGTILFFWAFPWVAGLERGELGRLVASLRRRGR
jgi:O-antigen/teichoic acid export membrane protein